MPHQKSTPNNKKRASLRRCASCNKLGHNARTCDSINRLKETEFLDIPEKKNLVVREQRTNRDRSEVISVNVAPESIPVSPHVVSLKNEELEQTWKNLTTYQANKKKANARRIVDFAILVREANKAKNDMSSKDDTVILKKPSIDILKEIARLEGVRDYDIQITPRKKDQDVKKEESNLDFEFPNSITHDPAWDSVEKRTLLQAMIERKNIFIKNFQIKKFAVSFVVIGMLASLPFPAIGFYRSVENNTSHIVEESTNAFLSLQASTVAAFNQNLPQAESDLNQALNSFGTARSLVDREYKALMYVLDVLPVVGTKIKSRQELLEAGHYLALGNAYLIKGIDEAMVQGGEISMIERLKLFRSHVRGALPQYDEALKRLDSVEVSALPAEYQESFVEFRGLFHTLVNDVRNVSDVISGLELMLGADGFKRYLVVFQNQYELRPTGGFIGSFGVIDVQNGKILNIDVPGGGSYDLQGQLSTYVKPPLPMQLINSRWEFQDANWFPDFRSSAEKLAWFYQKSRGTTVDGVIAINASILERLLRVIGPIHNDEYDLMLTSDSAIKDLSYEIESYENNDGENKPKAVLSVLLKQITDTIKDIKPEQLIALMTELSSALSEREIQAYFVDNRIETRAASFGWTGEIVPTEKDQDYLMVVNANIGGGKSDAQITQTVDHQAIIEEDGSIIDTVVITRAHEGIDDENTLTGQLNSTYVRVYVPEGAELLDAGGFVYPDESSFRVPEEWYTVDSDLSNLEHEISIHVGSGTRVTNEFGKTAFGNWMVTYPKGKTSVYFTYRLPFKAYTDASGDSLDQGIFREYWGKVTDVLKAGKPTSKYSMVMQKQSGILSGYTHTVIYQGEWRPVWKTGDDISLSLNGATSHGILNTDKIFGIVMKQQ